MDFNILLEKVERPWADVTLRLEFIKARERTPQNRADFEPAIITLERGQWFVEPVKPMMWPLFQNPSRPRRKQ